jgi:hypothetical protein
VNVFRLTFGKLHFKIIDIIDISRKIFCYLSFKFSFKDRKKVKKKKEKKKS